MICISSSRQTIKHNFSKSYIHPQHNWQALYTMLNNKREAHKKEKKKLSRANFISSNNKLKWVEERSVSVNVNLIVSCWESCLKFDRLAQYSRTVQRIYRLLHTKNYQRKAYANRMRVCSSTQYVWVKYWIELGSFRFSSWRQDVCWLRHSTKHVSIEHEREREKMYIRSDEKLDGKRVLCRTFWKSQSETMYKSFAWNSKEKKNWFTIKFAVGLLLIEQYGPVRRLRLFALER